MNEPLRSGRGGAPARGLPVTAIAVLTGLAIFGWHALRDPRLPSNIVIVTLDTTRADRLSAYGYMDAVLPHLDRLAAEGVVFDQAISVAPLTLPAHASLFTGLLPPSHGVRENASPPLGDAYVTLAEILRTRGFRTAAFVGSTVLDADRGLAQGFEHYSGVAAGAPERRQRRADEVIGEATRWLEDVRGARFFLWAHLYDPHRPYDPPAPYQSMHNPYLGEISFADSQIGRLLQALERERLLDQTIVIVAGDHGESLGDHGERDHGIFLYDSVLRVPFILRAPDLTPRRIGEVVRLTDVMPTVLELLGIPAPPTDGVSLVGLMRGTEQDLDLEAYAESQYPRHFGWSPLYTVRQGRYKFIEAPRPELYDLERDPFETRNIYGQHPSAVAALRRRVAALRQERAGPDSSESGSVAVTQDVRRRLEALGYIAHAAGVPGVPDEALPDPKDCIAAHTAWQNAGVAGAMSSPPVCR
jgi:choline-sulfatase